MRDIKYRLNLANKLFMKSRKSQFAFFNKEISEQMLGKPEKDGVVYKNFIPSFGTFLSWYL